MKYEDPMPAGHGPEFQEWQKRYVLRGLADMTSDPELSGLARALFDLLTAGEEPKDEALERVRLMAEEYLTNAS